MNDNSYRVDFHIVQMLYFDDNTSLPTGSSYSSIWSGLNQLGEHQVHGGFWNLGSFKKSTRPKFKLGAAEPLRTLLISSDAPINGGGVSEKKNAARPTCDCDFYVALEDASRCKNGPTLPDFQLAISNHWINAVGYPTVLKIMKENFEILDRSRPCYGFVDLSRPDETFAGLTYTSTMFGNAPISRYMDQAHWVRSTQLRRDQARSVYWGNYFGPRLIQKLGGRDSFLPQYRGQGMLRDGTNSTLIWEFENGVFLGLSQDPAACIPGTPLNHSAEASMYWLFSKLCEANAIIGA